MNGYHQGKHFATRLKRLIEPPWQSGSVGVLIIGGRQSVEEQRAEQEREAAATLMKVTESYRAQLAAARAAVAAELDEIILAQGAAPVASVATPRRRRPK